MCFIANTYAVIVRERRAVFKQPIKIHFLQSVLCWLGPAIIVACCLFIAPPGYKFLFVDLLAAGSGSLQMAYFAVTLPMQVTLGVSLSLLWSIAWHLRKVRIEFVKVMLQGTILRTVPTIVTAHTFCASRDTRVSYRWCLLI